MSRPARIVAAALRRHVAQRAAAARRPTSARATITSVKPLRLDLHGSDLELDDNDVELGQDVARYAASEGLTVGDVLVVDEVDEGDWIATTVLSNAAVRPVPDGG